MELSKIIYNDKNKKKAETTFGKGGSVAFQRFALVLSIAIPIATPAVSIGAWYFLSGRTSDLMVALLATLMVLCFFPVLWYILYRQYHYDLRKRDLIIYEDRIQLSHPRMTILKEDIEEIIIDSESFDSNKKVIKERIRKRFFAIANRMMITGMKDFKKHFIDHNAVIILHKRNEDRLGIQLLDSRAHRDMQKIKTALMELMGSNYIKPRTIGEPKDIPDIVNVRTRFDSKNHNKLLLKVSLGFVLLVAFTILSAKLYGMTDDMPFLMFLPIFSGMCAFFAFAFILGGFTMKLNGAGTGIYSIDGTYIEAHIASSMGYKIPLKAVESVEKWPDENNGHFFKMLKYDRGATHLPAHCLKNTFLLSTSKGIWPITKLGGATPSTLFFMGDDERSTGYNYLRTYIENRDHERGIDPVIKVKEKKREMKDEVVRIRFYDKRSVSRNFFPIYVLSAAYLMLVGFYIFFAVICIHALLQGNLKVLYTIPVFIFFHIFEMMVRALLVSAFALQIPYRKFKDEKLVIAGNIITLPWYKGIFGTKKVRLEKRSTEIVDYGYRKIKNRDLKRFKKLDNVRWTLLCWPFNRRILGRVHHPFDRHILFINENRAYFFPIDMLENDYQRKLDGIIEYGDDIYDE